LQSRNPDIARDCEQSSWQCGTVVQRVGISLLQDELPVLFSSLVVSAFALASSVSIVAMGQSNDARIRGWDPHRIDPVDACGGLASVARAF